MPLKSFNFSNSRVLTIGDVMLDEYWIGETTRISPEAPVPIVLVEDTSYRAGGAANVALNIAGLGCTVDLIGIIGDDKAGTILQELLKQSSKINDFMAVSKNHPTINKLRIISNNQQLFRLDREKNYCVDNSTNISTVFQNNLAANAYGSIVLSDYNKGTLHNPQIFISQATKYNIPVIIDPKNPDFLLYKNATILTPNIKEFQQMVDLNQYSIGAKLEYSAQEISEKGHNLINQLNLKALIITQGKHGLTVLTNDYHDQHFASSCHEVFDVTGAGDTVTATIAACIASGSNVHKAAQLATIAAGIVVRKLGTCYVSFAEVNHELQQNEHNPTTNNLHLGITDPETLAAIIEQQKLLGETIVLVNGCFDILHAGHVHYLEKAKSFGDRLIVAVNDDESIKTLKGNNRPINNLNHRMQVLAGLKAVDWVVPFGCNEIRPGKLIKYLNPNVLVKSKEAFKNIEDIPEYEGAHHVIQNNGKVYLLERPLIPDCDSSSSKVIETIKNTTISSKHSDKGTKEVTHE